MEKSSVNNPLSKEKILKPANGYLALFVFLALLFLSIAGIVYGSILMSRASMDNESMGIGGALSIASILLCIIAFICLFGLKVINPQEAAVLTLFGQYYGTIRKEGFYWVNPFSTTINPGAHSSISVAFTAISGAKQNTGATSPALSRRISLKTMTLNNDKQKVNDQLGNPVEIGAIVIWKVENTAKAVFNVQNYKTYLSIQCDSVIRNAARCYPYDTNEDSEEKTLRGSSQEVADIMKAELQDKVVIAGLDIIEVRITHLSYAPEIASAMLQRQQAAAIIDARQKIVEGAVSMVDMALHKLSENEIVELDEERKAAMVSNLLVVLCGNKDAQPIVNSGSIY